MISQIHKKWTFCHLVKWFTNAYVSDLVLLYKQQDVNAWLNTCPEWRGLVSLGPCPLQKTLDPHPQTDVPRLPVWMIASLARKVGLWRNTHLQWQGIMLCYSNELTWCDLLSLSAERQRRMLTGNEGNDRKCYSSHRLVILFPMTCVFQNLEPTSESTEAQNGRDEGRKDSIFFKLSPSLYSEGTGPLTHLCAKWWLSLLYHVYSSTL